MKTKNVLPVEEEYSDSQQPKICGKCFFSAWELADSAHCTLIHPHDGEHAACAYCSLLHEYEDIRWQLDYATDDMYYWRNKYEELADA